MVFVQSLQSLDSDVLRTAHGDRRAFQNVYDATHEKVSRAVRRLVRDECMSDEVVTDTYLQAWRNAAKYVPGRSSVQSWLLMMARCRAMDALRRQARIRGRRAPIEAAADVCSDEPETEPAEAREMATIIAEYIKALPRKQREAIQAAFFDGRTHSEVAAYLDQPLGTIKTRIRLGLASLRRGLEGRG
ncbi:ECF RNA polymerase sigma factor SigK [Planctomycetes bacterium Poly30]|uniref:ECF RNA polymerase sigma factor SigK n=1 Tax=Saltatorellus ferox TaxID=2528018 RepID=A0A518EM36_9BACT|nr:ECF RNA polymerase sigma factor SigK [Planctomycetes bacterium Poly30]